MNTAPKTQGPLSALLVGEYEKDRLLVHDTFSRLGWRLFEAPDRKRAMHYLDHQPIQVVIAETETPNWNWRKVLQDLRNLVHPPQLVVASRMADDYLWAEALNMGAYDVLPQPFDREELERVVASAGRHYESRKSAGHAVGGWAVAQTVA